MRRKPLPVAAVGVALLLAAAARADRGHIVLAPASVNVSVYGQGQKAIIGWNGQEEVLILSTDMAASKETSVLEFLPLPSKPSKIEKTSFRPFERIQEILQPEKPGLLDRVFGQSRSAKRPQAKVEVVFHEKIGAHDVTIARSHSALDFVKWMTAYVARRGLKVDPARAERMKPLVESYIRDGCPFFVCDIIKLGPKTQTVEPLVYRFTTDRLWFPLRVSALDAGRGDLALFLLTHDEVDVWGTKTGFVSGHYGFAGGRKRPVKTRVDERMAGDIHRSLGDLFKGSHPVLKTAVYHGQLSALKRDFVVRWAPR